MKVAIVHDDLMRRGGAEKVVKVISEMYPEAPIFTLAYKEGLTYPEFKSKNIFTSWFQHVARNEFMMKWLFFPFGIFAMRNLKVEGYDVVIMSTTYCAKYVKVSKESRVFAYCYTPFRLAWNPSSYNIYHNSKGVTRWFFDKVINRLKKIDLKASNSVDYFIAMTKETRQRLIDAYHPKENIPIINPPVELNNFKISSKPKDYYLIVSRFEPYKKVDLAINAFNENGRKLVIVGRGSQLDYLKSLSQSNIEFKHDLSNEQLGSLYENCRAFIFPQYEDYGITPLEANAAGRPVIAYGKGGVLDTMVSFQDDPINATAYFFERQDINTLNRAIEEFEKCNFTPENARKNAERFSEERFKRELSSFIEEKN